MSIHAPKIGFFGHFAPKLGSSMNETPKGTSLGGNTSYDVQIVKIGPLVRARREPKNIAKKVYLRNQNMCFFTCSSRPPTLSQRHVDLRVWAYPRPGYICQVSSKSVQGFRCCRGSKLGLPITLASRFYNSQYGVLINLENSRGRSLKTKTSSAKIKTAKFLYKVVSRTRPWSRGLCL